MKKIFSLLLAVVLLSIFIFPLSAAALSGPSSQINYLALGDSIAAGVLYGDETYPMGKSGVGYTNNLYEKLESAGLSVSFSDPDYLCHAGNTAFELAERISSRLLDQNSKYYYLVKKSQIITITIGANDLLEDFYTAVSRINDLNNVSDVEVAAVLKAIAEAENSLFQGTKGTEIQKNIETILQSILSVNPSAKIYVMGYYNPLPLLATTYHKDLTPDVAYLNTFIFKATRNVIAKNRGASISYIDTLLAMTNGINRGLLVPKDIHPTKLGYQVIANLFWAKIRTDYIMSALFNR